MRVSLFGNSFQDTSLSDLGSFIGRLTGSGLTVEVESAFYDYLHSRGVLPTGTEAVNEPTEDSALVISCGGDGTLLRAARWVGERQIPVAGLNTGHLGYLTTWRLQDTDELLEVLLNGRMTIENRSLLHVECEVLPSDIWSYALNEVGLLKAASASIITVQTHIDGRYLTDYVADGLLMATPSGSTAYTMSAGGPILQPTLSAVVLTPVAPHTLSMRPLVVDGASRISAVGLSRSGHFLLTIDNEAYSCPAGTRVEVTRAPFTLRVVRRDGVDFASTLRDKLLWGRRNA